MKTRLTHGRHTGFANLALEYFGVFIAIGLIFALLGFFGMNLTSSPLAFVVYVAPSLVILGYFIFSTHSYIRIFQSGNPWSRISRSLILALISTGIMTSLGYWIWITLWKSSPYIGP